MLHSSRSSGSFKISLNGTLSCLKSIHLACRVIRCGGFVGSPVVKDLRYMDDLTCLFHTAENKIIVLRSVKFSAETSGFLYNRTSHNQKMTDIIVGS